MHALHPHKYTDYAEILSSFRNSHSLALSPATASSTFLTLSPSINHMPKRSNPAESNARIIAALKEGISAKEVAEKEGISKQRVFQIWENYKRNSAMIDGGFGSLGPRTFRTLKRIVEKGGGSLASINDMKKFIESNPGWKSNLLALTGVDTYEKIMKFLTENGAVTPIKRNGERIELLLGDALKPGRGETDIWTFMLIESGASFGEISERSGLTRHSLAGRYHHYVNVWTKMLGSTPTFDSVWGYLRGTSIEEFTKVSEFSRQTMSGTFSFALKAGKVLDSAGD